MALSIEEHEALVKMHAEKRENPENKVWPTDNIDFDIEDSKRELKRVDKRKNNFKTRYKYWVYFIQWAHGGPIKIGRAKNVSRRLASHQVSSPYEIVLLCMIEAHNFALEKKIHYHFDDYRIRGEWFKPHENILEFVDVIKRREFKKIYAILGCDQYARRNEEWLTEMESRPFEYSEGDCCEIPVRRQGV